MVHYISDFIGAGLRQIQATYPDWFIGIRQNGVVMGLEFDDPQGAKYVMRHLYENGVWAIFSTLDPRVLQYKPGILLKPEIAEDVERLLRGLLGGLAKLHVARRQGPEALARLDRAPCQQDLLVALVVPGADRTGHDLGILVVNEFAAPAHQALAVVTVGNALLEMLRRIPRQPGALGDAAHAARIRAATPGSVLPSIHSRNAPPAVDT